MLLWLIVFLMFLCEILNILAYLYKNDFLKYISKNIFFVASLGLILIIFNYGNCPLHSLKGSILVFALFLDIISLFFIIKYKLESIISIVSPILGLILVLSLLLESNNFVALNNYKFIVKIHILTSFLAYASFLFSGIVSILFLRFHRSLKKKTLSELFKEVPSFPFLEKAIDHATAFGLIVITFSLVTGFILLKMYYGTLFVFDVKVISLILLYILYIIFFILRFVKKINSYVWAKYNILASLFLLILFIFGNSFLPGIHSFK